MSLFKKKAPREIKEDDSLLVKLWYNPRTHAMMVLGIYLLFFAAIITFSGASLNKNNNKTKVDTKNLEAYFINLDDKDITYNIVINKENDVYYFSGYRTPEGSISGKLLHNSDAETLAITPDACQIAYNDGEVTIIDEEKKCPEFMTFDLFDYYLIYEKIKSSNVEPRYYKDYYLYKVDNVEYKIYVKGKLLTKIEINKKDISYTLNFLVNALDVEQTNELKPVDE